MVTSTGTAVKLPAAFLVPKPYAPLPWHVAAVARR
jgi:hypothetical protein